MPQTFQIQFGDDKLQFRPATIEDPVPTGTQLLDLAGARPTVEHFIFRVLNNGLLEELRPDETTDLRTSGVEKFLIFRSDRSFRFELDGRVFDWGASTILGATLKKLAGVDPVTYGVWQEVRRSDDRKIEDSASADLNPAGVERFFTGIVATTEG